MNLQWNGEDFGFIAVVVLIGESETPGRGEVLKSLASWMLRITGRIKSLDFGKWSG